MKKYQKMCKILRKHCPLAYPVSIRRLKMVDDGDCTRLDDRFLIRINKRLNECEAIDTLMHEWAHARAWSHLHDAMDTEEFIKKSHDAAWGVAYSEVYQCFERHYIEGSQCKILP